MSNWFLNRKDYKDLDIAFSSRYLKHNKNLHIEINEISSRLEKIMSEESFANLFYTESLWICSQARKHNENAEIQSIVLTFLEEIEIRIRQFNIISLDMETKEDSRADILNNFRQQNNSIISIAISNIKNILGSAKPCLKHCLTIEEVSKVKRVLTNIEMDNTEDDLERLLFGKQLEVISSLNKYASFHKYEQDIYKLYDISQSDDQNHEIALACLKYIIDTNDVIKDSYGLLGLVDDLYALELTFSKIDQKDDIQNLVDIHNKLYPSFKLPEIVCEGGIISTLNLEHIVKASYSKKDTEQIIKRLMIVPDIGPLSILSALGNSICNRLNAKDETQNINNFCKGDHLLIGILETTFRTKKVIVKFDERSKEHPHLFYIFDRAGQRQTIQKSHLKNAFLVSPDSKISREKTISKFKNKNNPEIQGWSKIYFQENISKIASNGPIYLFTTKYIASKFLKEKIYGNSIEDILGVREFDSKYKFTDTFSTKQLFPEPQLYVIADDVVGVELLNNRIEGVDVREPSLVIIDNEKFYKNSIFMNEVNIKEIDTIIFIEVYKEKNIKSLLEDDYSCLTTRPNKDFSTHSNNFLPIHSPTGRYLERQSAFKINYKVIKQEVLSKLINLIDESRGHLLEDHLYLYYKIIRLKDSIRSQSTERTEVNIIKFRDNLKKIIDELAYLAEFNYIYKPLLVYLEKNGDRLLNTSKAECLEEYIQSKPNESNVIVVSTIQIDAMNIFLAKITNFDSERFKNTKVVDAKQLEDINASSIDNVIIPSFISKPAMRRFRNYKYGKNHIYFGIKEEKLLHDKFINKDKVIFESNFNNSAEFISFKKENTNNESSIEISVTDLFRDIFASSSIGNINQIDNSHLTKSKMLGLDDDCILLIPENGKELVIDSRGIYTEKANMLNLHDEILINSEFSGEDLIKNILKENNEEYNQYLSLNKSAKSWKEILKNYEVENNYTPKDIQRELKKIGVSRELSTIRHWLNSPYTVAPQKRDETIRKIFALSGNDNEDKINKCLASIDSIRKLTNAARLKLIDLLNKENISKSNIKMEINNFTINFERKTIYAISDIEIPSKYLYKVHDLDSFMLEFNNAS